MSQRRPSSRQPFPWAVHPIWRGIGCVFAVLIPAVSFVVARTILQFVDQTEFMIETPSQTLPVLGEVQDFWVIVGLAVLLIPAFFVALSVVGAIVYSFLGGPRNEELAKMDYLKPHDYDHEDEH